MNVGVHASQPDLFFSPKRSPLSFAAVLTNRNCSQRDTWGLFLLLSEPMSSCVVHVESRSLIDGEVSSYVRCGMS
jgi:hypothetical protein